MIYSQWRPDGGYDYYETRARRALGTDLPTPRLFGLSPIGIASTDIGRPLPLGARKVGSGPLARGQVVGMSSLSGLGLGALSGSTLGDLGLLTAAVLFGWWLHGALMKDLG